MRVNTGGIVLILLGLLLLANNLGFLPWTALWKFWPVILVGAGIAMLLPKREG